MIIFKGVFAREEEYTTGIGDGIAIPHCKSGAVKAPGLAAMVLKMVSNMMRWMDSQYI